MSRVSWIKKLIIKVFLSFFLLLEANKDSSCLLILNCEHVWFCRQSDMLFDKESRKVLYLYKTSSRMLKSMVKEKPSVSRPTQVIIAFCSSTLAEACSTSFSLFAGVFLASWWINLTARNEKVSIYLLQMTVCFVYVNLCMVLPLMFGKKSIAMMILFCELSMDEDFWEQRPQCRTLGVKS